MDNNELLRNLVSGLDEIAVLNKQLSDAYAMLSTVIYENIVETGRETRTDEKEN